jgi:hypothetical protein
MHVPTQPPPTRLPGSRALHRALAVALLVTAFAVAGQSVAQAADHGHRSWRPTHHHTWRPDQPGAGGPLTAAAAPATAAPATAAPAGAAPAPAPAAPAAAAPAPASSSRQAYKDYALEQLGGDTTQMSCLDKLWTAESGWNPNARNPRSTAYGIPQFLDSTWKSTGIAKTSNPYRQIDAGLVYVRKRYGTPCGAWSFFSSHHWY